MPSIVLLLKRKPGMTMEEFRHHYETSHAAMAVKYQGHAIADYRRSYIHTQFNLDHFGEPDGEPLFDAVTVLSFDTDEQFAEFRRASGPHREEFLADEFNFLDRAKVVGFYADVEISNVPTQ